MGHWSPFFSRAEPPDRATVVRRHARRYGRKIKVRCASAREGAECDPQACRPGHERERFHKRNCLPEDAVAYDAQGHEEIIMRERSMKRAVWFAWAAIAMFGTMALTAAPAFAGATKVEVCHIPPGNPDNFHTIHISEKALPAHLAHGDLSGDCDDFCEDLCDDGDACTIDACDEVTGECLDPADRAATDCNDSNACTADSCVPETGCVNAPRTGEACDDGQACTGPDSCNVSGQCAGDPIGGCCESDAQCDPSLCARETCDLQTNTCQANPVSCDPPDQCTASACDENTGECVDTPVVCGAGETCNPATGACEGGTDPTCAGGDSCAACIISTASGQSCFALCDGAEEGDAACSGCLCETECADICGCACD